MESWVENPRFENYDGLPLNDLEVDEAYLKVISIINKPVTLYSLSEDCYKCPYTSLRKINASSVNVLKIDTKYNNFYRFVSSEYPTSKPIPLIGDNSVLCDVTTYGSASKMGEFGVYELVLNGSNPDSITCKLRTLVEPVNIYLSLLLIVLIITAAVSFWNLYPKAMYYLINYCPCLHKFRKQKNSITEGQIKNENSARKRVKSLDTFRGISIILMIFVNYGGGNYWFMEHATWNGLQVADLLFPWFMWIMGVCIPISVRSILKKAVPLKSVILNILRRSIILFGLGVMLNTAGRGGDLEVIRIFGVLQRFGVAYLIVTTCAVILAPKNGYQQIKKENFDEDESSASSKSKKCMWLDQIVEVTSLKLQWCFMLSLVAIHLLITFLLPIPGCPTGYLGPGGIERDGVALGCAGGATGYIDQSILGKNHIYGHPTSMYVYKSGPFDPEGIFGCLLSIFQVFLGVQAGTILLFYSSHKARLFRWLSWGVITGALGALLCLCSKEEGWIPVNKNLWSLSFVLVTSSFAFFLLSFCYILVDVKGMWDGTPFLYPGMNSTIMYVGHSIAYQLFPWHWKFPGIPMNKHFVLTIEALWGTGLWVLIAYILYRKKKFLTI